MQPRYRSSDTGAVVFAPYTPRSLRTRQSAQRTPAACPRVFPPRPPQQPFRRATPAARPFFPPRAIFFRKKSTIFFDISSQRVSLQSRSMRFRPGRDGQTHTSKAANVRRNSQGFPTHVSRHRFGKSVRMVPCIRLRTPRSREDAGEGGAERSRRPNRPSGATSLPAAMRQAKCVAAQGACYTF